MHLSHYSFFEAKKRENSFGFSFCQIQICLKIIAAARKLHPHRQRYCSRYKRSFERDTCMSFINRNEPETAKTLSGISNIGHVFNYITSDQTCSSITTQEQIRLGKVKCFPYSQLGKLSPFLTTTDCSTGISSDFLLQDSQMIHCKATSQNVYCKESHNM